MPRFNQATDRLLRTSDMLDYNAAYTIMAWIYLTADLNTACRLFTLNRNTGNDEDWSGMGATGTQVAVIANIGGTQAVGSGTNLSLTTWYHIAMVRESVSSLRVYLNGVSDAVSTQNITGRTTLTRMEVGAKGSSDTNRFDGRVNCLKLWSTNLSADEVLQEMNVIRPVRTANLYSWSPTFPGSGERALDYSGNGRDWTEGGTLTDEDPPPVSWGTASRIAPFVVAAGGGGGIVLPILSNEGIYSPIFGGQIVR